MGCSSFLFFGGIRIAGRRAGADDAGQGHIYNHIYNNEGMAKKCRSFFVSRGCCVRAIRIRTNTYWRNVCICNRRIITIRAKTTRGVLNGYVAETAVLKKYVEKFNLFFIYVLTKYVECGIIFLRMKKCLFSGMRKALSGAETAVSEADGSLTQPEPDGRSFRTGAGPAGKTRGGTYDICLSCLFFQG